MVAPFGRRGVSPSDLFVDLLRGVGGAALPGRRPSMVVRP